MSNQPEDVGIEGWRGRIATGGGDGGRMGLGDRGIGRHLDSKPVMDSVCLLPAH